MKMMLEHATTIRLMNFAMIFILVALWEIRTPRRPLKTSKKGRWINNLSIIAITPVLLRLVFPLLALEAAQSAQVNGWGLPNRIENPSIASFAIGIVLLGLAVYLQHMMFHADLDYDLTTGLPKLLLTFTFWLTSRRMSRRLRRG